MSNTLFKAFGVGCLGVATYYLLYSLDSILAAGLSVSLNCTYFINYKVHLILSLLALGLGIGWLSSNINLLFRVKWKLVLSLVLLAAICFNFYSRFITGCVKDYLGLYPTSLKFNLADLLIFIIFSFLVLCRGDTYATK